MSIGRSITPEQIKGPEIMRILVKLCTDNLKAQDEAYYSNGMILEYLEDYNRRFSGNNRITPKDIADILDSEVSEGRVKRIELRQQSILKGKYYVPTLGYRIPIRE